MQVNDNTTISVKSSSTGTIDETSSGATSNSLEDYEIQR